MGFLLLAGGARRGRGVARVDRDGNPARAAQRSARERAGRQRLAAARNEWVSFQILLRSDEPVEGVRVEAGDLQRPGRDVAFAGPSARLYRQHQLHLEVGTYRNDGFKPDWYPDPLIPFVASRWPAKKLEGARFTCGCPSICPANETHGFWVDIYVPAETRRRASIAAFIASPRPDGKHPGGSCLADGLGLRLAADAHAGHGVRLAASCASYYRQRAKANKEPEPSDWAAVEAQCAPVAQRAPLQCHAAARDASPGGAAATVPFAFRPSRCRLLREFVDRYHVNAVQTSASVERRSKTRWPSATSCGPGCRLRPGGQGTGPARASSSTPT